VNDSSTGIELYNKLTLMTSIEFGREVGLAVSIAISISLPIILMV
jgi:hypothetical protein